MEHTSSPPLCAVSKVFGEGKEGPAMEGAVIDEVPLSSGEDEDGFVASPGNEEDEEEVSLNEGCKDMGADDDVGVPSEVGDDDARASKFNLSRFD
ncbi:hypothetical protein U1Q18_017868 [Sarracenia purpurea var. burkii]